ncbi:MAG: serine O-acetyltransferase CysE [Saliniramus fredricksonii]|uniref:Serine acetyltransferase n=1 Tax=Saliniramus fredricksonii TaxID=1653334 RepID=A0A0P7X706_9HYPH|nr:serine O-acetyltransferase [Saliniramus fredricksonii]KPQ10849.1 MAG: serine O-acetyltransferase CysE [Saliniramus fredricksonii]SCC81075.1 serine O-acetyltransferase [Saliniramus fredricksonii]
MARTQTKSDAAVSQRRGVVGNLDPIWDQVRHEAEAVARNESALTNFVLTSVLNQPSLEAAVIHRVASRLAHPALSADLISQTYMEAVQDEPGIGAAFRADIIAVIDRDPACTRLIEPLLYFKGFHAIQTYRLAHWLWHRGRRDLALYLQSVSSETFQTDINPQATIGKGIFLDHATGLVVGATASVDDDVSILQDVTLGGTGKESGDRHPKIRCGVLIGAGAKILGNIEVGHCARVAAGSVVLEPVPHNTTVAGVPARVVGTAGCAEPARTMDQILAEKQGR